MKTVLDNPHKGSLNDIVKELAKIVGIVKEHTSMCSVSGLCPKLCKVRVPERPTIFGDAQMV